MPRNVVNRFSLTVAVEQCALKRYEEHMKRADTPPRSLELLKQVIQDGG